VNSPKGTIRGRREAKVYAVAVIAGFVMVPVFVILAVVSAMGGSLSGFVMFLLFAAFIGIVTARYSKHLSAYTNHEKETN
jgi:mannose/fructose/N-acetylgalactosamine-specific phosphotransferase system component IID